MDDKDKSIVEKTFEAVEEFASEIKHMMEPEPLQPGDELVMLPIEDTGVLGVPMPPHVVARKASGKKGAKTAAKKPGEKSAKTALKRAAKKKAAKKPKKSKAKSAAKKNAKKAVKKKKAKKSRP